MNNLSKNQQRCHSCALISLNVPFAPQGRRCLGRRLETGLTGTDRLRIRRNSLRMMRSDQHWFTGLGEGAAPPVMLSHLIFGREGCASRICSVMGLVVIGSRWAPSAGELLSGEVKHLERQPGSALCPPGSSDKQSAGKLTPFGPPSDTAGVSLVCL